MLISPVMIIGLYDGHLGSIVKPGAVNQYPGRRNPLLVNGSKIFRKKLCCTFSLPSTAKNSLTRWLWRRACGNRMHA